jgi:hypothetical protein
MPQTRQKKQKKDEKRGTAVQVTKSQPLPVTSEYALGERQELTYLPWAYGNVVFTEGG